MANPYLGQVSPFAFPFAPVSWAFCNGGTVPLNQFTALFALIGTVFGGNGRTTIGLPNLNGMSPAGAGQGPGLSQRVLGQSFGTTNVAIDQTTLAPHIHGINAATRPRGGTATGTPSAATGLSSIAGVNAHAAGPGNVAMSSQAISMTLGGGAAHNNLQPYLTVNYCIALQGTFPYFD